MDDAIFHQTMVVDHRLETEHRGQDSPPHDQVMWGLVGQGLYSRIQRHRGSLAPFNPNLERSYRYTAVVGDRLWAMLLEERAAVSELFLGGGM